MAETKTKPETKLKALPEPADSQLTALVQSELERRGIGPELAKDTAAMIKEAAGTLPRWAKILFGILGAIGTPAIYAFFSTAQAVWSLPARVEKTEQALQQLSTQQQTIIELLKGQAK